MKTSESIVKIYEAFCLAQGEFGGALKNAENPHFSSAFSNLESIIDAIKKPFAKNGLAFLQSVEGLVLSTRIIHKSGEWIETTYPLSFSDLNNPQKVGSSVTYAKRYGLQAAVGVPSVDDDGEVAVRPEALTKERAPAQPVQSVAPKFQPPASVQARAAAAPKIQAPFFPKVVEGSSDLGSYVVKIGKKYKDLMLSEIDIHDLNGYVRYFVDGAARDKKPLDAKTQEFVEMAEAFLKSRLASNENPTWTVEPHGIDQEEPLPF